jgi:hypothetical protein
MTAGLRDFQWHDVEEGAATAMRRLSETLYPKSSGGRESEDLLKGLPPET